MIEKTGDRRDAVADPAVEITLSEVSLEAFYPADEATAQAMLVMSRKG